MFKRKKQVAPDTNTFDGYLEWWFRRPVPTQTREHYRSLARLWLIEQSESGDWSDDFVQSNREALLIMGLRHELAKARRLDDIMDAERAYAEAIFELDRKTQTLHAQWEVEELIRRGESDTRQNRPNSKNEDVGS